MKRRVINNKNNILCVLKFKQNYMNDNNNNTEAIITEKYKNKNFISNNNIIRNDYNIVKIIFF